MKYCITNEILEEYNQIKAKAEERLKIVFLEFGPLQYWEELHYIQKQLLDKYNIGGI